jgi:GT2 family glycosyltransferase
LSQESSPEQVVVVGRAEDEAARKVVNGFGDRVVWQEVSKPGHVEPLRAALTVVSTPFVAVLDDDAEPLRSDWLARLIEVLVERDNVACVGSQVRNVGLEPPRASPHSGRLRWYGRLVGNVAARTDSVPVEVDALPEGNWAWRTNALKSCDIDAIWDSGDASMYSLDLCLQVKATGWRVLYTAAAPVLHHLAPRDNSLRRDDLPQRSFAFSRNMTYIALKHYRWRLIPFSLWTVLVGERYFYGLLAVLRELSSRDRQPTAITASLRGRVSGVEVWVRRRAQ